MLINCRTCRREIDSKVKVCPFCSEKSPKPFKVKDLMVWVGLTLIVMFWVKMCEKIGEVSPEDKHRRATISVQMHCEDWVKQRLKSPGSAKFASYHETGFIGSDSGPWTVSGYVDSQNSFGAFLRSNYVCRMRFEGETARLEHLEIK